ncbi:unnamed protein product, partial [Amoebophrya sp. A25]
ASALLLPGGFTPGLPALGPGSLDSVASLPFNPKSRLTDAETSSRMLSLFEKRFRSVDDEALLHAGSSCTFRNDKSQHGGSELRVNLSLKSHEDIHCSGKHKQDTQARTTSGSDDLDVIRDILREFELSENVRILCAGYAPSSRTLGTARP